MAPVGESSRRGSARDAQGNGSVALQAKATLQILAEQSGAAQKSATEQLADIVSYNDLQSSLQAWFHHFDLDQSGRINYREFERALKVLAPERNPDNVMKLWQGLDYDQSGEISFDEFAYERDAESWSNFRRWCGSVFQGSKDMIRQLKDHYAEISGLDAGSDEVVREREFCEGRFFHAFDLENEGCIYAKYLRWVDREVKMFKMKEAAKKSAQKMARLKARHAQETQGALRSFKECLQKQYGNMFKAWRGALDTNSSMTMQRAELFKAVKTLNWKGDCRALWRALDHDNSGITTIEELDANSAQLLAEFKLFAQTLTDNPKRPSLIFNILDRHKRKKLSHAQFIQECEGRGFTKNTKMLANCMDWQDKKFITEVDLQFLDVWRTPAWLTASPDPEAAESFKHQLVARLGHIVKAWKVLMDKDQSNSCNWHEFQQAAKSVRFTGDVAGAWLALDADLSGSISLEEIDSDAHASLTEFKVWADSEFGGVKSAFKVLDADGSGSLSFHEFKLACRNYGFPGDCRRLFKSLDQQGEGMLAMHEVFFLDGWKIEEQKESPAMSESGSKTPEQGNKHTGCLLEYWTENPGPGSYTIPSSFGHCERVPGARHGGAFSFAGRNKLGNAPRRIGPAKYCPNLLATTPNRPAYSFSAPQTRPASADATAKTRRGNTSAKLGLAVSRPTTPGPGAYDTEPLSPGGPKFTMRPRRALPLHPSKTPD
eukprot:TRINITY_DN4186_c0_g2_i2.p1 TRINITY_DN4186_c0_g2~~TRINITY_DN4186_c0_g2_i2.p1  ORF type:complete len:715 (-),score=152.37 TRINITY_DN4186_c0_g2_i2:76-2220(-)